LAGVIVLAGCGSAGGPPSLPYLRALERHGDGDVRGARLQRLHPLQGDAPVMEGIQKTSGDQVNVVFYDVWEDDEPARDTAAA
jgi:hypothetical protein